ncbi:MAG: class GN sortase [Acidobacteriota bacterium]|jgi:sortase A
MSCRTARALGVLLILSGGLLLARDAGLRAKGVLAGHLVARAFERHLRDGGRQPPWPWADTYPLARLEVERLGVRAYVLSGAQGASLAFGAGHLHGTAPPGGRGHVVLAGHRDTSFAFLRELRRGDRIRLRTHGGDRSWIVEEVAVAAEDDLSVIEPTAEDRLTLLTCYPFEGPIGSPWRYVVTALPESRLARSP